MEINNHNLYIFGGNTHKKGSSNELAICDLDEKQWKKPHPKTLSMLTPEKRQKHGGFMHEGKLFTFGGQNKDQWFYDLQCIETMELSIINSNEPASKQKGGGSSSFKK
mmetsp:Transcript_15683/g.13385  ORF Transcript_15683/g.13385 Transcript_15683/m.13385 type:complete len:108 (+) Transcript_15683:549-872(+)